MDQIVALIDLSSSCSQTIITNCTHSPLENYALWTDRQSSRRKYWHGDNSDGKNGCKCMTSEAGCLASIRGQQVDFFTLSTNIF